MKKKKKQKVTYDKLKTGNKLNNNQNHSKQTNLLHIPN
jgi:hypothetical protein